jgi:hypothetical protein
MLLRIDFGVGQLKVLKRIDNRGCYADPGKPFVVGGHNIAAVRNIGSSLPPAHAGGTFNVCCSFDKRGGPIENDRIFRSTISSMSLRGRDSVSDNLDRHFRP